MNPADAGGSPGEVLAQVSALRAEVRRDLRATSIPLLLLGGATALGVLPRLFASVGWFFIGGGDWLTALCIAGAFVAMWLYLRRREVHGGVGRPAGFGAAAVVALCCTVSIGVIATFYAGPFFVFGLGLLIAGIWQRNRLLVAWAVLAGSIGVFEGFFGITNRLPVSIWRSWEHPAIYLALAIATILAGLIAWWRESRER